MHYEVLGNEDMILGKVGIWRNTRKRKKVVWEKELILSL